VLSHLHKLDIRKNILHKVKQCLDDLGAFKLDAQHSIVIQGKTINIGGIQMSKDHEKLVAVLFGAAFLVALLFIAIQFQTPTTFQYTVFRIILAISAAGFASVIPGFLEVTVPGYVRAGGALGVFVVVYFFSPAALVANP
jgi:hypothetical protein